ncbi:MAG TPA: metallophosphoesterase [Candidatus Hydrogenedentes bacterium]|nr:metallophosphoesterase [Candidatus Hydrogenedentota bacterium]HRK33755.1 metallophosphoesterase [Candidatus Hydrogenedentota bacterium]
MSEVTPRDTLLHVADLHFWHVTWNPLQLLNKRALGNANVFFRRARHFAMDRAASFVDTLDAAGPKTMLFTGDFSSTSLDAEFVRARQFVDAVHARGFDIHLLPGNHDVYTFGSQRTRRFEHHFAPYLHADGCPARVTLPGGTPMILVPTVCANWLSSRGRISDEEIAQVRALVDATEGPIIVAGHYPVLARTVAYELTPQRQLRNATALHDALGESGKEILYIAGHVHRFSYGRDPRHRNLTHLTTGTFFGHNAAEGLSGEFCEVRVNPTGFSVIRHTFDGAWRAIAVDAKEH